MKPSEILRSAAINIAGHWTQRAHARDVHGEPTDALGPKAVCWCLMGRLRVETDDAVRPFTEARNYLCRIIGGLSPTGAAWNDAAIRTEREVLTLLNNAASLAEAEGC